MLVKTFSASVQGLEASAVTIEVNAARGIRFVLVGLPYGFVIGFALGTINLVPLLGTVICLPIALLLAFFGDGGFRLRK